MIIGMSLHMFTVVHVIITLIAIDIRSAVPQAIARKRHRVRK